MLFLKRYSLLITLLCYIPLRGAHLVGGEISYKCLGNNDYEISLTVYRDCISQGAQFDQRAVITIYDANNTRVQNLRVPISSTSALPLAAPNNCTSLPPNICTEKAIYIATVNLPPIAGGYTITHQRCCRNGTITNIPNPDTRGNTYTTTIPSLDSCNSSPSFNSDPPVVLCLNQKVDLNLSVTETNGDSVHYELCQLLTGGGQNNQIAGALSSPVPDPAGPPPYTTIGYGAGYSINNPIPSNNPGFSINSQTGILSGRPTSVGQFVFAICAEEYRNGVRMSTIRRDFQFNVSGACQITESIIQPQSASGQVGPSVCTGKSFQFTNLSINGNSFFWDFGDPSTTTDTSNAQDPTYIYPDTGTYNVMLVANPGTACADTSFSVFEIYDPIQASFTYDGQYCTSNNLVNFEVTGTYSTDATFEWDFGGTTNLGATTSTERPQGVTWDQPGRYYVTLTIKDFVCESTFGDTVTIYPDPVLRSIVPFTQSCIPFTVGFMDNSSAWTQMFHLWDFGDGTQSTDPSPTHLYRKAGTFTVTHSMFTLTGCQDSLFESFENFIVALPVPKSGLSVDPLITDIYNPDFTITNESEEYVTTLTYLPNGQVINDLSNLKFSLDDTGTYKITHVATNKEGCTDTIIRFIEVEPLLNFFIPNAFTPNGDGINDKFLMSVNAVISYNIQIYNRWGELIFESNDQKIGWDGFNPRTGAPAQVGGYSYRVQVRTIKNRRDIVKYGTVHLLR